MIPSTVEQRWSCSVKPEGRSGMRAPLRAASVSPSCCFPYPETIKLTLWLAGQVVVRVLGKMRESAASQARLGTNIAR